MKLKDMLGMSFGNLYKRKLRTALTVAGVVVGTGAIVMTVSIGLGYSKSMEEQLAQMGDLTIINVYSGGGGGGVSYGGGMMISSIGGGSSGGGSSKNPLNDKMIETFQNMENVQAVTPIYQLDWSASTIVSGKYEMNSQVYGLNLSALEDMGYQIKEGQFPTESDGENAILFGESAPYQFRNTKKRGSQSYVNQMPDKNGKMPDPFVNVLEDKLSIGFRNPQDGTMLKTNKPLKLNCTGIMIGDWSRNPDSSYSVFMSVEMAKKIQEAYNKANKIKTDTNDKGYSQAIVKVDDMRNVAAVEKMIKEQGFNTSSMETIREPMEKQSQALQMFLGILGGVTLLVSAISIANTMIMSVYERTREIGVMKVLGCLVGNIRLMFLLESAIIGFFGGALGLGVSYGVSYLLNTMGDLSFLSGMFGGMSGSTVSIIPPWLAIGAMIFSVAVGVLSGAYPANRAVRIQALTAIKQE